MDTPLHSINIDFSHSSEAKVLLKCVTAGKVIAAHRDYLEAVQSQLIDAIQLLESLEA
ncbi:hypothetical protein L3V77_02810 [Vibrio sp. DW001]|uniref:hypothetical protein n=1 Tax=Vibrio sp. DW001 TaxID=2912315 RepID=UPI0023B15DD4|nr:hypothetical protein [Vibrio sp. DW001]WED27183.1 hypothetical protein L3V77_02810 [Vibrio sp. DW001]